MGLERNEGPGVWIGRWEDGGRTNEEVGGMRGRRRGNGGGNCVENGGMKGEGSGRTEEGRGRRDEGKGKDEIWTRR